ncbi:MAG: hypothetical protein Q8R48_00190, partial [Candidatus Omnitrophota bacterium]|nr:hypothetical protein [Candidatus Omnitrophota bacterium]
MKTKIILLAGIVIAIFLLAQAVVSAEESAGAAANEEAIMVLSTNTIAEMRYARKVIEEHGGKIISIFPPSVFIGKIPSNISEELKKSDIIEKISYENVDAYHFKDYESSTIDAINLWNKSLEEIAKPVEEKTGEEKYKKPFTDDLIIPRGLSKTKDEKIKKDKEYSERWKQKKAQLQRNEGSKKQEWQKKRVRKKTAGGSSLFMYAPSAESMSSAGTTSAAVSNFGAAYGAGYYDTSLYMAGDIAVGVFFAPGTAGNWTTAEIDAMFTSVRTALSQFINDEPNARVTFTYIKEVDEGWNPKPIPLDEEEYVNDLRNTYNTHWAYMIVVYKGSGRANANLFGPSIRLYSYDLRDGYALRHETMHIFGAMDQYHPDAARSPIDRWGYLNVVNANSQYNNDKGYFGGAGEGAP